MLGERVGVLVAAAGASWEVAALQALARPGSPAVLLKRCVDLPDLLASAATGQARAAVVADGLDGLDAEALDHLRRTGVGVVLVAADGVGPHSLPGVGEVVSAGEVRDVAAAAASVAARAGAAETPPSSGGDGQEDPTPWEQSSVGAVEGRVVAVWGATGAPGRTTVAVSVAAALAARGHDTLLVDADGYGGAVAQHLGVLDEVSGLLGAVRLAHTGRLDEIRLAAAARTVAPGLRVLTGLPRADRWVEVRALAFDAVVEAARRLCAYVVLDLGFALELEAVAHGSSGPQRNLMTLAGLDHADEVLVVGSADPVGLARLARGLVELEEHVPLATTRVVVNRMRPSLGWNETEVRAMVEGFATPAGTYFLPEDRTGADRALMAGRPVTELGGSSLGTALDRLVAAVDGAARVGS